MFLENEPQDTKINERPRQRSLERIREVLTIFRGPHVAGESRSTRDWYTKEAWSAPLIDIHRTIERPVKSTRRELKKVFFTKAYARWVHHLYSDTLVIIARVANNNVHKMLVDNRSAVDIIYLDAYKRIGLTEGELISITAPLYEFTRDHVIPKDTIKLTVTVGEHPQVSIVMTKFLIVDYPSAFNRVIERPLLKALKAITSIYLLTMKFPTTERNGQVKGSQYDSRECYNKSLELDENEKKLP